MVDKHPDEGKRVRLVSTSDRHTDLKPGDMGTIAIVDDVGTRHIDWDDGHALGLIPNVDHWEMVE